MAKHARYLGLHSKSVMRFGLHGKQGMCLGFHAQEICILVLQGNKVSICSLHGVFWDYAVNRLEIWSYYLLWRLHIETFGIDAGVI